MRRVAKIKNSDSQWNFRGNKTKQNRRKNSKYKLKLSKQKSKFFKKESSKSIEHRPQMSLNNSFMQNEDFETMNNTEIRSGVPNPK